MEFNAQQLLFEPFLDIMHIFSNIEPSSESTFPFFYIIIFQTCQSLEGPRCNLKESRHMHPLTFLYGIQCSTTFIWSIFGYKAHFWQRRALKWIYFPIFQHYNILNTSVFGAPSSSLEGGRHIRPLDFFVENLILNNCYSKLFSYNRCYAAASSHKLNLISHFYTL